MSETQEEATYYVYPSWASFSYEWCDLPRLFSDPLGSGYLDQRFDWEAHGWVCDDSVPYEFIDCRHGGGIITICADTAKRTPLYVRILQAEANVSPPRALLNANVNVHYLEPFEAVGAVRASGNGQPRKAYLCYIGLKSLVATHKRIYWVVKCAAETDATAGKKALLECADDFALAATLVDEMPPGLRSTPASWAEGTRFKYLWVEIEASGRPRDYVFAAMIYVGFHLKKIAGKQMQGIYFADAAPTTP